MKNYITLDCGTTKTKISLVSRNIVRDSLKINNGNDVSGYKDILKERIADMLQKNLLTEKDIIRILATGTMATAEFGIFPADYLTIPVSIDKLKKGMCEVFIPEISNIPFGIVRGVKTSCTSLENADTMRGEESELMGIMGKEDEACAYMLMGSHSKIIKTNDKGNITDICTMLTGELAGTLAKYTILKHSIDFKESVLDGEYLKKGYMYCRDNNINEALFKVRVLKNIFGVTQCQAYSFFLGTILFAEVKYVIDSKIKKVVVGGNKYLKEAVYVLLKEYAQGDIMCLSDEKVENSVSLGLVKIFEHKD